MKLCNLDMLFLERILREILLANPKKGPALMIKVDIKDGFYRLVVFPTLPGQPHLVALPMVLPMGWKNNPPIFCTTTETVADIAKTSGTQITHQLSTH